MEMIKAIVMGVFGFYFNLLDGLAGRPDSLEAMIVFGLVALVLTGLTIGGAITFVLAAFGTHYRNEILELLNFALDAVMVIRSVAPFWAWAVVIVAAYQVGSLFGAELYHSAVVAILYTAVFSAMTLAGLLIPKHRYEWIPPCYLVMAPASLVVGLMSVPMFGWTISVAVAILTMFWGLIGLAIQMIIEARQSQPVYCRG